MSRKTHAEHVADIVKINPNVEILEEIKNVKEKVLCRCLVCSHKWRAAPDKLKQGRGCPECAKAKIAEARRLTHAEHVAAIKKVNPEIEVLGEIINSCKKVLCRCKICGYEWMVTPADLKSGRGCPECGKIKRANKRRLTHTEQAEAINKVNPNIEILEEITGSHKKVLCRCEICGYEWMVTPDNLKHGEGCPECGRMKSADARRKTHTEQVADIKKVNPNVEVLEEITGSLVKVPCRCKICSHRWEARPSNLKQGCGCPRCAKYGFYNHTVGKLYIMVDNLEAPTMMKIGVSVREDRREQVLRSAHKAGVFIPALHVAKTWEGPTDLMHRIEQMMHENFSEWNIKFPAKFNGCTEFFYYTPETAEVFDIIEETYRELINANKAA